MTTMTTMTSMTTIKETETESDLDSNRNSCDVFDIGNGFCICREASLVLLVFPMFECKGNLFCILKFGKRLREMIEHGVMKNHTLKFTDYLFGR